MMTEISRPWPGSATGDKGPYTADQWRLIHELLVSANASGANIGILGAYRSSLAPSSSGNNNATLAAGGAIADGTIYDTDAAVSKTITSPSVDTTGKRLVLQKDWTAQTVRVAEISSADGTAAIPALTQSDGATWEIPLCSFTITTGGVIGSLTDEREFVNAVAIPFIIDGGGAVIVTGVQAGDIPIPRALHLYGWEVLPDQSGSIVVDVWEDTYANYPATDADTITGGDEPTVTATTKAQNFNIAPEGNWTLDLAKGGRLRFNVDSVTTVEYATVTLFAAG